MINPIDMDKAAALRRQGSSIYEIGKALGCHGTTVYNRLRKRVDYSDLDKAFRSAQIAKHLDVEYIRQEREKGRTMKEIADDLGATPSGVCYYISKMNISDEAKSKIALNNRVASIKNRAVGVANMSINAINRRIAAYTKGATASLTEADIFMAGLYLGEGTKSNRFSLANSNPNVIKNTVDFLLRWGVPESNIQLYVQLAELDKVDTVVNFWKEHSGIHDVRTVLKKPLSGKTKRRLPFGTVVVIAKKSYGWQAFEWIFGIISRFSSSQRKGFKGHEQEFWQCSSPEL